MKASSGRDRVLILHQGFVPIYRKAFFERLEALRPGRYVVAHGAPPPGNAIMPAREPFAFEHYRVRNLHFGGAVYQTALTRGLSRDMAAVVLGHEAKYLSNAALALGAALTGRRAIYWGFGYHRLSGPARGRAQAMARALVSGWKNMLARAADGYLAYTASGADALIQTGLPPSKVAVLRNTIDVDEQIALARDMAAISEHDARLELGLPRAGAVFLFVGRLIGDKRVERLIEAVRLLRAQGEDVHLAIVGDGPERAALEAAAAGEERIRFEGALAPADPRLALWFKLTRALAIPGFVGLAVNHAFAHGAPVLTCDHPYHSPEFDYLVDGDNALIVRDGVEPLAAGMKRLIEDMTLEAKLKRGAHKSAGELDLDAMARRFDDAVARFAGLEAPTPRSTGEQWAAER